MYLSQPPNPLTTDPDFLAAVDYMANQSSSSTAPPPADGLHFSAHLYLVLCTRLGMNHLYLVLRMYPKPDFVH